MMSLMRSRPLVCYQLQGFGEFLSSGSRAQSSHFPDPVFLPSGAHEKTKGQWGSFGITVTMRGKHNCTPAWVSLETHYTVETRSRTRAIVFPPIVITANTKRFTKWDFKRLANTQSHSQAITKSAHLLASHCPPHLEVHTCRKTKNYF